MQNFLKKYNLQFQQFFHHSMRNKNFILSGICILVAQGVLLSACAKKSVVKSIEEQPGKEEITKRKQFLVIGIDGLTYSVLQTLQAQYKQTSMRAFDSLANEGMSIKAMIRNGEPTWSAPGWATSLTGNWVEQHGINSNTYSSADLKKPTIFAVLSTWKPEYLTVGYAGWTSTDGLMSPPNKVPSIKKAMFTSATGSGIDSYTVRMTDEVIKNLQVYQTTSMYIFMHYKQVDALAHQFGYGDLYNRAVLEIGDNIKRLCQAIRNRTHYAEEDWTVVIYTDHGRQPSGFDHGGDTEVERTSFLISNKKLTTQNPVDFVEIPRLILHQFDKDVFGNSMATHLPISSY